MPSTRDPILLLEPSNLLEPLDLADRHVDPANPTARAEREDSSRFMRPVRRDSISAPIERDRSWRLKSAVIVVGAFACIAAGAALPQLPELAFGDRKPAQQTKPSQQTVAQTIADATKQPVRVVRTPAKSEEAKPAEPKPNEPITSGSNQSIALTANPGTQPPVTDQPAPVAQDPAARAAPSCGPRNRAGDDKCLEGGVPEPAAATARPSVPDRNSDSAAAASRTTAASPTKPRAAPQSIWELDEGAQQSVNRRTTQRDAADQPATADNNGQSARPSDRNSSDRNSADRNSVERDRRQDQDSYRASSRRRERSGDNGQTARYGEGRQEQDSNRSSSGRRDRYDDARGEDRRVGGEDRRLFGRGLREDDRVVGGPRHEGPIPIFPSLFGW